MAQCSTKEASGEALQDAPIWGNPVDACGIAFISCIDRGLDLGNATMSIPGGWDGGGA